MSGALLFQDWEMQAIAPLVLDGGITVGLVFSFLFRGLGRAIIPHSLES